MVASASTHSFVMIMEYLSPGDIVRLIIPHRLNIHSARDKFDGYAGMYVGPRSTRKTLFGYRLVFVDGQVLSFYRTWLNRI